jgi:hypothetical protein
MRQPEATFKQRLTKCFAKVYPEGWWTYLTPVKAGTPDLVFAVPGAATVWVEAKVYGKRPTLIQERQIALMRAAGMHVAVLTAHMTQEERPVCWRRWSLAFDTQVGSRIMEGGLMNYPIFWEAFLL